MVKDLYTFFELDQKFGPFCLQKVLLLAYKKRLTKLV